MEFFEAINLTIGNFIFFCAVILIASFVRGFSGFGFSASSISLLTFILPPVEVVPIILLLEVIASFFMIPSIWDKINWKFVIFLLFGVTFGTPVGVKLLSSLEPKLMHIVISVTVIFFAIMLLKGYKNKKLNHNFSKFFVGVVAGTANGFGTLAGLPIALYFLIIAVEPAVIRASIAALFFFTDSYALILTYLSGLLELSFLYRTLPLIFIVPVGVFMGTRLFKGSTKESYKKYVLYFLIIVSIFGLIKSVI
ncbi:MAG: sulfite exporter TauE/SafE family protein [Pseudomonadota bacterium]|nr:sulfite exporter TauE/SafE family protein [Pseudomonadota bacterium]